MAAEEGIVKEKKTCLSSTSVDNDKRIAATTRRN